MNYIGKGISILLMLVGIYLIYKAWSLHRATQKEGGLSVVPMPKQAIDSLKILPAP